MKSFIGTCVENPFGRIETLCNVVEGGKKISKKKFLNSCYVEEELIKDFKKFPHDYAFYQYENIMFYTWGAIEHFYE